MKKATAGSGGAIADANATASVCPKGWKLPTSGTQNNNANDSFYNLLVNYGLTSSVTGSADGIDYNIATTPLYFVRSGYIRISSGYLLAASSVGYAWINLTSSKLPNNAPIASTYYLTFNSTSIRALDGPYERWLTFPLRCLISLIN